MGLRLKVSSTSLEEMVEDSGSVMIEDGLETQPWIAGVDKKETLGFSQCISIQT